MYPEHSLTAAVYNRPVVAGLYDEDPNDQRIHRTVPLHAACQHNDALISPSPVVAIEGHAPGSPLPANHPEQCRSASV
jgi:hypothetical protein